MEEIIWDKNKFSVGNQDLDDQHKKIIELLNILIVAKNTNDRSFNILDVYQSMCSYALEHLEFEENLLCEMGYKDYLYHKSLHAVFEENISKLADDIISEDDKAPTDLIDFLVDWLTHHILVEDMKFKPLMTKNTDI